jgi:hypothetical protein
MKKEKIKNVVIAVLSILVIVAFFVGDATCKTKVLIGTDIQECEAKGGTFSLDYSKVFKEYQATCDMQFDYYVIRYK